MADGPRLTDSAAVVLHDLEQRLRAGWSGTVQIQCEGGGVSVVKYTETYTPRELLPKQAA